MPPKEREESTSSYIASLLEAVTPREFGTLKVEHDAPKLLLSLPEIGGIGLPLTTREGKYLESQGGKWTDFSLLSDSSWVAWIENTVKTTIAMGLGIPKSKWTLGDGELRLLGDGGCSITLVGACNNRKHNFGKVMIILPTFTEQSITLEEESLQKNIKSSAASDVLIAAWHYSDDLGIIFEPKKENLFLAVLYDLEAKSVDDIPQWPDHSTTLWGLTKALSEWNAKAMEKNDCEPIAWVFDSRTDSQLENNVLDRVRSQLLVHAAKTAGMVVCMATATREMEGKAKEWWDEQHRLEARKRKKIDRERRRLQRQDDVEDLRMEYGLYYERYAYALSPISSSDEDESDHYVPEARTDGRYTMVDCKRDDYYLSKFTDLQHEPLKNMRVKIKKYVFIAPRYFDDQKEDSWKYDKKDGSLVQEVHRLSLVMWPTKQAQDTFFEQGETVSPLDENTQQKRKRPSSGVVCDGVATSAMIAKLRRQK